MEAHPVLGDLSGVHARPVASPTTSSGDAGSVPPPFIGADGVPYPAHLLAMPDVMGGAFPFPGPSLFPTAGNNMAGARGVGSGVVPFIGGRSPPPPPPPPPRYLGALEELPTEARRRRQTIASCKKLIKEDGKTVVVSGLTPMGCASTNLTITCRPGSDAAQRQEFNETDGALRCCCGGGGGRFNYNVIMTCGMPSANACADPLAYVN
ncbi:hypothetical protein PR202_ga24183 [Eleusine coracana subsp. coracana]|uniref:Uncharacterized protein n=1 Tax=Eleusine coracana subsp. coracana TaxID=191504 RepID=A0AAV5D853_ELECO|nr:hypothetical protein PR202_ga24183 [Eleusine coracana subsp. coracana]